MPVGGRCRSAAPPGWWWGRAPPPAARRCTAQVGGAHRDLGLAVADVAAHEPVHGSGALHVALDLGGDPQLIVGVGVGEALFEQVLQPVVGGEGEASFELAPGLDLEQVGGQVLDRLARLLGLALPAATAELGQPRRACGGPHVAPDQPDPVGGDEQVAPVELEVKQVARLPIAFAPDHALETRDPVGDVHHVGSGLEVGEALDREVVAPQLGADPRVELASPRAAEQAVGRGDPHVGRRAEPTGEREGDEVQPGRVVVGPQPVLELRVEPALAEQLSQALALGVVEAAHRDPLLAPQEAR